VFDPTRNGGRPFPTPKLEVKESPPVAARELIVWGNEANIGRCCRTPAHSDVRVPAYRIAPKIYQGVLVMGQQ